jgi:hypothetical protein
MGLPLQRSDSGKPVPFIADTFPAFSVGNWFCGFVAEIGFPLLADSRNWHAATSSFILQRETSSRYWFNSNFCYQLIGFLLSVICRGRSIKMDQPHTLA